MEAKIDIATAYRAYSRILAAGEPVDGGRRYAGLVAYTDHDGYGVTLAADGVSARLLFHSQVKVDAPSRFALHRFAQRLKDVAALDIEDAIDEDTWREHKASA